MNNTGYLNLFGVDCVYIEEENSITLIPKEREQNRLLVSHFRERDFIIQYFETTNRICTAFIERINLTNSTGLKLFPKYILKSNSSDPFVGFEMTGEAIDDFFRPASYFFYRERKRDDLKADLLYQKEIADKWDITFEGENVTVVLSYGDIFLRGIASDLMLHPKLTVKFTETDSTEYIYCVYLFILRFLQIVRYSTRNGKIQVELLSQKGNGTYYSGKMTDFQANKELCLTGLHDAEYISFKPYIQRLLQFAADNPNYSFKHYPEQGPRFFGRDYTPTAYLALFSAFENECHASQELYECADSSPIKTIKKTLLNKINELASNECTDEERQFLQQAKSRISQIGTQLGQKMKIVHAYHVLYEALSSSIENIFYGPELRLKGPLQDVDLNNIADSLVKLRGSIVHGNYIRTFSDMQAQMFKFFEILIYSQMLKRAGMEEKAIELIVGAIFSCNYVLFHKLYS